MPPEAASHPSSPLPTMPATRLDRVGIWASSLCAVHCLAAPLLFLLVPAVAGIWAHPASHALIALLVVPLALHTILGGYRVHQRRWVLGSAVVGVAAILVGCVLPYVGPETVAAAGHVGCESCCPTLHVDESGSSSLEWPPASISTMVGSVFLVAAHAGNLLFHRGCRPGCPS